MKIIYLVLSFLLIISCKSNTERTEEYYNKSFEITMCRDSIDTVIELLDKAIELNPDNEKYYLAKGQLYLDYCIIDSAINSLLIYKKYNQTNYTAAA